MSAFLLWRPISDTDIFWQLKLGEITLREGLPATEPFLINQEDRPHVPVAWLAQVVYAAIRTVIGWDGLHACDVFIWLGGPILLAFHLGVRQGNWLAATAALFLGHMVLYAHSSLRPQSFSLLGFSLIVLMVRYPGQFKANIIWGGAILILWQNLHPSVVAAGLWLGCMMVGEWVKSFLGVPTERRGLVTVLPFLAAIAVFATPAGAAILPLSQYNAEASKWFTIGEWLPVWDAESAAFFRQGNYSKLLEWQFSSGRFSVWVAILLTLFLIPFRWRQLDWVEFLASLPLLVLTLVMHRFVLFWGIAMIPIWFDLIKNRIPPPLQQSSTSQRLIVLSTATITGLILVLFTRPTSWVEYHPFLAVDALKASGYRGPIYCNYFQGGTLIDFGYPEWKVTHDGRYYLFPLSEWKEDSDVRAGVLPIEVVEKKYRFDAIFLRGGVDDALIGKLLVHPGWKVIHHDQTATVFLRR